MTPEKARLKRALDAAGTALDRADDTVREAWTRYEEAREKQRDALTNYNLALAAYDAEPDEPIDTLGSPDILPR